MRRMAGRHHVLQGSPRAPVLLWRRGFLRGVAA